MTCKRSERPDGKNMPWSVVMPVHTPVTLTATTPVRTTQPPSST